MLLATPSNFNYSPQNYTYSSKLNRTGCSCSQGLNNNCGESSKAVVQLGILRSYKQENSEISAWHAFKTSANILTSQNPFLG